jgi:hypothetical protein
MKLISEAHIEDLRCTAARSRSTRRAARDSRRPVGRLEPAATIQSGPSGDTDIPGAVQPVLGVHDVVGHR